VAQVQAAADYACSHAGGEGAVREVCDLICDAHAGD
jgi:3-deoxy-D-manno-octulosonate 8-phosphate phosphatase KdsC-like HAD superfamily phosphatase